MEYIGCSGFMYDHWRGTFYPEGLAKKKWFSYYIEYFNTVELNVTFYRLPKIGTFRKWREMTPKDFRFALKGSRYITHIRRLNDVANAVEKFFDGALELGNELSIVLWQLPPNFGIDIEKLDKFLRVLKPYQVRNTFEFRHETWICEETEKLLKRYGYCYCTADWPNFLKDLPVTTSYAYIRRHGRGGSYDTDFTDQELKQQKKLLRSLQNRGARDVYIFFNNDYKGYAPKNALTLKKLINPK